MRYIVKNYCSFTENHLSLLRSVVSDSTAHHVMLEFNDLLQGNLGKESATMTELKDLRGKAFTKALAEKEKSYTDLATEMCNGRSAAANAKKLASRFSNYARGKNLMPMYIGIQVEIALFGEVNGRILCYISSDQKKDFLKLVSRFKIMNSVVRRLINPRRTKESIAIGANLRAAMHAANLNKERLSAKLTEGETPLAPSTINNICTGWTRLTEDAAIAISPLLGLSPSQLMDPNVMTAVVQPSTKKKGIKKSTPAVVTGSSDVEKVSAKKMQKSLQGVGITLSLKELGIELPDHVDLTLENGQFQGENGVLQRNGEEFEFVLTLRAPVPANMVLGSFLR